MLFPSFVRVNLLLAWAETMIISDLLQGNDTLNRDRANFSTTISGRVLSGGDRRSLTKQGRCKVPI